MHAADARWERDLFFGLSMDLLCIADSQGRFVRLNEEWERVLGWPTADLIGRPFLDLVHPDDKAATETITARLIEGTEVVDFVNRYRGVDGSYRHLEWRSRYRDGLIVAAARDITERTIYKKAAHEGEERYRSLFDYMTEVVVFHELVYDQAGTPVNYRILDANPAWEASTGLNASAAIGKLATEVYGTPEPPYFAVFSLPAIDEQARTLETYFPPLDRHYLVSIVSPAKGYFYTVTNDITERKRDEIERERLLAELAEKNRDLERYLYVASHDLRSPLVNVQGFGAQVSKAAAELTRLLAAAPLEAETRARVDEILAARVPRALGFILSATGRMDRLINGLLKLSRTGRAELVETVLDMNVLVADAAASIRHQLDEAKAALAIADLPPCLGDKDLISAAVANILDNAVKYRSAARPLAISIEGSVDDRWSVYRIDDTGPGIPPDQRQKVFDLFYRYDKERNIAGDGIGLAHAKKIMERHGGSIHAEESPDGGTRIELRLPAPTRTTARSMKKGSAD